MRKKDQTTFIPSFGYSFLADLLRQLSLLYTCHCDSPSAAALGANIIVTLPLSLHPCMCSFHLIKADRNVRVSFSINCHIFFLHLQVQLTLNQNFSCDQKGITVVFFFSFFFFGKWQQISSRHCCVFFSDNFIIKWPALLAFWKYAPHGPEENFSLVISGTVRRHW